VKSSLIKILKIVIPILVGVYICWYFWTSFDEEQKQDFFLVFKQANYFWVGLALILGFISHWSRAKRWKYALRPLGHNPSTYNSYNAIMIGYIANIVVPRMGEASRAGVLKTTENVPFEKGFGSIVAERVIDVICLALISGTALLINLDKIDDMLHLADVVNANNQQKGVEQGFPWGKVIFLSLFIIGTLGLIWLWVKKPNFKEKVTNFLKGLKEGLFSIFKMKEKWQYLGFTALIWVCYVSMFWVVFFALPFTSVLSVDAIMVGFVAGTIGFIVVQGGIGTYPILVGIVVTFFRNPEYLAIEGKPLGEDVGFGALVWASQTILIVALGLISLFLVQRSKKRKVRGNQ
jgi:glycosyltransferase 2 family protein